MDVLVSPEIELTLEIKSTVVCGFYDKIKEALERTLATRGEAWLIGEL